MPAHYLQTKIRVKDLDAAIRFYQTAFGYSLRSRRPGPHDGEIAFLVIPGESTELQLAQYPAPGGTGMPELLMHLAYRVDHLESTLEGALQAGATLVSEPYQLPSGSRVAFIKDPDGYDIELVQKP